MKEPTNIWISKKKIVDLHLNICYGNSKEPFQGGGTFDSAEYEISTTHNNYNAEKKKIFLAFKLTDVVFIMLINVKMPTIIGILTFMMCKKFYTLPARSR